MTFVVVGVLSAFIALQASAAESEMASPALAAEFKAQCQKKNAGRTRALRDAGKLDAFCECMTRNHKLDGEREGAPNEQLSFMIDFYKRKDRKLRTGDLSYASVLVTYDTDLRNACLADPSFVNPPPTPAEDLPPLTPEQLEGVGSSEIKTIDELRRKGSPRAPNGRLRNK